MTTLCYPPNLVEWGNRIYTLGRCYAREIAAQYGISYDQLTALLQQRGVLE